MHYRLLILIPAFLLLTSCGSKPVTARNPAEQHFLEGERLFEKGRYDDAITAWEQVRDSYYSPELNMLAELKIAEAYYKSEQYAEAATAYDDFLKQHPNDERKAQVMYHLGMSYYQQILVADRDQTGTENALRVFQNLLRQFPDDQHAARIKSLIRRCRNRLAEHEVYVGWFYQRTEAYQSAIARLEAAIKNYPEYKGLDEAYFYLGKAYLKSGEEAKGRENLSEILEKFPTSQYREEAEELLAAGEK